MSTLSAPIPFTKMHAQGNDVILVDALRQRVPAAHEMPWSLWIRRRFGIGADHLAVIEAPRHPQTHAFVRIVNADGSNSKHVLQALRCVASYAQRSHLLWSGNLWIDSPAGTYKFWEDAQGHMSARWRLPEPPLVPQHLTSLSSHFSLESWLVPLSTPHCVILGAPQNRKERFQILQNAQKNLALPFSTPITFCMREDKRLNLHTHWPGLGWLQSSGEGALAAAWLSQHQSRLLASPEESSVWETQHPGGCLHLRYQASKKQWTLSGPVTYVCSGHSMELDEPLDAQRKKHT